MQELQCDNTEKLKISQKEMDWAFGTLKSNKAVGWV